MNINKPQLSFEVVHRDDHLIEVEVIASNGRFAGSTSFYSDADGSELVGFAEKLRGFPKEIGQVVEQEFGYTRQEMIDMKEQFFGLRAVNPHIGLKFFCVDRIGHTVVDIVLFDEVCSRREGARGKVSLELLFDPASLDLFVQELMDIRDTKESKATLVGNMENQDSFR